ncbi:hypothetical protein [Leisingera daeponensis]|uniref:hypothetical protein n=1 Tax=Leisingera daeponensis TaxID=405746 RepID=UPI001C979EED|nr:hypothetical protein [Leisingera daeponensis]MBY6055364.1 hypothetical protein [Leisingera daeponensis]
MKQLTSKQANTLLAFLECYDLYGPGWPPISDGMRNDFGVEDPEEDLEDARGALAS